MTIEDIHILLFQQLLLFQLFQLRLKLFGYLYSIENFKNKEQKAEGDSWN